MAIHDRIVGPLFRRLSISKRQSQCDSVPGLQPEMSCATCSIDLRRNSSEYAICLSPESLALYEGRAKAYRNGFLGAPGYPRDLLPHAHLACEVVPALIAEIRRLREGQSNNT